MRRLGQNLFCILKKIRQKAVHAFFIRNHFIRNLHVEENRTLYHTVTSNVRL